MGDIMNKLIIKSYINKLTQNDIKTFCIKKGLNLTKEELDLITHHIKNNYNTIIYENPKSILNELKIKLKTENYQKIEKLYIEYKNKYKNYL